MENKVKILISGDVEGKFDIFFKRIETINKKSGPFDLLLCVGNFFGINNKEFNPYILGNKKVPIPTYILGPNKEDHVDLYPKDDNMSELCANVCYLGKRGVFCDSNGLRIGYISGLANTDKKGEEWNFTKTDAMDLCNVAKRGDPSYRGIDILLTSQWPDGIVQIDNQNMKLNSPSEILSYMCLKLKPRYIISGLEGIYYERPPFRCPILGDNDSSIEKTTRFIGLARVANPNKEKWLYALNLTPLSKVKISELLQRTTDETPCPFNISHLEKKILSKKKRPHASTQGQQQYFYDMTVQEEEAAAEKAELAKQQKKRQKVQIDPRTCWFCLASVTFEKHLVLSIAECTYLALAKGGLVEEHFTISPIEHFQNSLTCPEHVQKELNRFKKTVRKFYARNKKVPVFFERNYKTSHLQIHAIPIPESIRKVDRIYQAEAAARGFKLNVLEIGRTIDEALSSKVPFFIAELPEDFTLYTKITHDMNFPLDFGREVVAKSTMLNLPDKADYKKCISGIEKEDELVMKIRADFEMYDFTL